MTQPKAPSRRNTGRPGRLRRPRPVSRAARTRFGVRPRTVGSFETIGWELLKGGKHRGVHVGRDRLPLAIGHRAGYFSQQRATTALRGGPRERRLAGEHLVSHGAERIDVASARRSRAHRWPARGSCTAACLATVRLGHALPRRRATASAIPKSATSG